MRPLRFLLTLLTFALAFLLLVFAGPWSGGSPRQVEERGTIGTYFSWRTPSSLFPPSAIISITDDNSTNFVARPAAFGPLLPAKSLSGQLWIGSGFGDDHLGRGDGELGCSDVPGWDDGSWTSASANLKKSSYDYKASADSSSPLAGRSKRDMIVDDDDDDDDVRASGLPSEDDGTDDYLHHPLPPSDGLKTNGEAAGNTRKPTHADIQSLQESAEIAGKVVLLSRGGCGFLEKVKWVQRRGGIALIVGDDIRGGPLVTMYARGDTSNVTIPSLFTSHTTAQLLSSLMPSGTLIGAKEAVARHGFALKKVAKVPAAAADARPRDDSDRPNFTTTTTVPRATLASHAQSKSSVDQATAKHDDTVHTKRRWFAFLFGTHSDKSHESRRPPSSGNIGWMVQQEFDDDEYERGKAAKYASISSSSVAMPAATPKVPADGFQIGVQDWRDPDLVAEQREQLLRGTSTSSSSSAASRSDKSAPTSLKGGSITPSSGSYGKASHEVVDMSRSKQSSSQGDSTSHKNDNQQDSSRGWFARLLASDPGRDTKSGSGAAQIADSYLDSDAHPSKPSGQDRHHSPAKASQMHEGLWVTLSPASMSTSPFFDTLLVLVVSPLVTLTVVYALLLLRSRIRRRRWRAPKSVVERLPVRTYQTISSSTASSTSSVVSAATATTPLLPSASRPINTRPRRARTTSGVPQDSSMRSANTASPPLDQIEEKRAAGLAEWRRRYGGKQRECVVCLEEYVDGVSRVMSLPCGHEFHAECITPWLTTRRRTCPICKGDVVRSLARSGGSSSTTPPTYQDDDQESETEHDIQELAVTSVNDDPSSQQPVSREDEAFSDLERGMMPDRTR